ncbi:MAG: TAXI family TRAP transporter solute-binding subunit [Planctomycetaceae bacterium]|nr:TAXI family TRAP transporter solute-binding subunit [bacterium]MDB4786710.1 TAXI family TRAP transporter solute-binding subunit [Planctomycetaceae bacterium]MDG2391559.1 TAXI family TRAP transporter solute-binding subunit [Planctomycetaceae bacterium]
MRQRLLKLLLLVVVILLPFLIHWLYLWVTMWPKSITMATGPVGGRHRMIMEALAGEIREQLSVDVELKESEGSLRNLRMLEAGEIDFGLYQSGARRMIADATQHSETTQVRFVSNLYSEVAHWAINRDSNIGDSDDLRGKRIAVGQHDSGDSAMSLVLAEHFGLSDNDYEIAYLDYDQVRAQFLDDTLDVAFITVGVQADVFRRLCEEGKVEFRSLENIDALVLNHISLTPYTIPKGLYQTTGRVAPLADVHTVALKSQLLCRDELPDALVEQITEIALSEDFMKEMKLGELFSQGVEFASAKPEFAVHFGAAHYFDPRLKPILNSDFVEAMEGMRSFLVSLLIAGYLGWRWWVKRSIRQAEHRLDRYIRRLLEIERSQVELGESPDSLTQDGRELQVLLDHVTNLRQECLKDFTAHELNEDRSVDCFLEMCHALSDKINAKLTRVTLEENFAELRLLLHEKTGTKETPPTGDQVG